MSNLYLYFLTTVNDSSKKNKRSAAAFINRAAIKGTVPIADIYPKKLSEPVSIFEFPFDQN